MHSCFPYSVQHWVSKPQVISGLTGRSLGTYFGNSETRDLKIVKKQGQKPRELKPACLSTAEAGSWKLQFNSQQIWGKKKTNLNNRKKKKKERNPRAGDTHTLEHRLTLPANTMAVTRMGEEKR